MDVARFLDFSKILISSPIIFLHFYFDLLKSKYCPSIHCLIFVILFVCDCVKIFQISLKLNHFLKNKELYYEPIILSFYDFSFSSKKLDLFFRHLQQYAICELSSKYFCLYTLLRHA